MALAVGALMAACAKQGEAERCSRSNGDDDCQGGLTCVLRGGISSTICCPPSGQETTVECRGEYQATIDSGSDGAKETAPIVDTGKKGALGSSCTYDSECDVPLRCRAGGKCLYECIANRDCDVQYGTSASPLPFCDTCADHLCHSTDRPEYHLNDAGVCPTGDSGTTDATTEDGTADVGDDAGTDTAVDDSATTDSTTDDASDGG